MRIQPGSACSFLLLVSAALLFLLTSCGTNEPTEASAVTWEARRKQPTPESAGVGDTADMLADTEDTAAIDSIFDWLHEQEQEVPEVAATSVGLQLVNAAQSGATLFCPNPTSPAPSSTLGSSTRTAQLIRRTGSYHCNARLARRRSSG